MIINLLFFAPMKKNIFILLLIVLMAYACKNPEELVTLSSPPNTALSQEVFNPLENGYKLVWEDNFDGSQLDFTKWNYRGLGNKRGSGYIDSRMVKVYDGNLLLMFDYQRDSVFSGMVGTMETFQTKYGYFECRAQLNKGYPQSTAFWLQSPRIGFGDNPGRFGAEIDIAEYMRELGADYMTHCIHWAYGSNPQSSGRMDSYLHGLSKGFHTFALEWTPQKYTFFIDGLKYHEQTVGLSHVNEYMILSMLPGLTFDKATAIYPDTFFVDYVKVYQKTTPDIPPTPKNNIVLRTTQKTGETIGFRFLADEAAQENVFVDLNGNGEEDFNETVNLFGTGWQYENKFIVSQPNITVYGDIKHITCAGKFSYVDCSGNPLLEVLDAWNSEFEFIDVSENPNLTTMSIARNNLKSLNVSKCSSLSTIIIASNQIKGKEMTDFMNSLPARSPDTPGTLIIVDTNPVLYQGRQPEEGNIATKADVNIAKEKNWNVYDWNGFNSKLYEGS